MRCSFDGTQTEVGLCRTAASSIVREWPCYVVVGGHKRSRSLSSSIDDYAELAS
jgi:hypothetical protein